jgi:hypothetical protein
MPPRKRRDRANAGDAQRAPNDWLVVDRLAGDRAIIVDDTGHSFDVPASTLPATCRAEGAVLRVPRDGHGGFVWPSAQRDRAEEARRLAEAKARLERLKQTDPGGDVVL